MNNDQKTKEIREQSGSISSDDKLVSFFYTLMRDHLTPGIIEELVQDAEKYEGENITYTNGWLAKYAINLSERLKK